jgi:hypothetical protein
MTAEVIPLKPRKDHLAEVSNALLLLKVMVAQNHSPMVISEILLKAENELALHREQMNRR